MSRIDDQFEQRISELAAGEMSEADAALLRARIAGDPALAQLAAAYARLDRALRGWRALPAVDWTGQARRLRHAVEDDLARLMSQYHEGLLGEAEKRRVAQRFAADATAARVSREFQHASDLLDSWRALPTNVDWRAFHARVSGAVRRDVAGSRRRRWIGWASGLALAACVGLLAILSLRGGPGGTPSGGHQAPRLVTVEVERPRGDGRVAVTFDPTPPPGYEAIQTSGPARGVAIRPTGDRASQDDAPGL